MQKPKIILFLFLVFSLSINAQQNNKPKLVVGIVVDQMRADYFQKYDTLFGKNGFRKLLKESNVFEDCEIKYFPSYTGPGHASIYTGTTPTNNGIIANDWYDRNSHQMMYVVSDSSVISIGGNEKNGKMSPKNLKTTTLADELKISQNYKNKTFGISIKDRGAVLPAGHTADGAFWFDAESGNFISSSYYMSALPLWLQRFNEAKKPEEYMKQTWNTLYDIRLMESFYGKDDNKAEGKYTNETAPVFPHDFSKIHNGKNYKSLPASPYGNSIITDLAIELIKNEKLGENGNTDMLSISYSSTDYVGHQFGFQSVELADIYARLDREIEKLLLVLDQKYGKDGYVLFLSSDHGAVTAPLEAQQHKLPYTYFKENSIDSLKVFLHKKYKADLIENFYNLQLYLNYKNIHQNQLNIEEIKKDIRMFLKETEGIKEVILSEEIKFLDNDDEVYSKLKNGYDSRRCGDIFILLEPNVVDMEMNRTGTTHGSVYTYDTRIPFVLKYPGLSPKKHTRKVYINDIAPTLSYLLKIPFPSGSTGDIVVE